MRTLARALHVSPGYFREYRLNQVIEELEDRPDVIDLLFEHLVDSTGPPADAMDGPFRPAA